MPLTLLFNMHVQRFACIFFLSQFLGTSLQQGIGTNGNVYPVVVTSESQCNPVMKMEMEPDLIYKVQMSLLSSPCKEDSDKMGFYCEIDVTEDDPFTLLGRRLCVDLQGVAKTMPNTQLLVRASDKLDNELQRIYTTTVLRPVNDPYYVCSPKTARNFLNVTISVRKSVRMCPENMASIVGHNISLGTFSLQQVIPVYALHNRRDCPSQIDNTASTFILDVYSQERPFSCKFKMPWLSLSFKTKVCLEVEEISFYYHCETAIVFSVPPSDTFVELDIPKGQPVSNPEPECVEYLYDEGEERYFQLVNRGSRNCGRVAFKVSFSKGDDEDDDDDNKPEHSFDGMRHLYMAVFISLICMCLLILGLTCVCCLRIRRKRLARTQRRRSASSNQNPGFDHPSVEPTLSWHQSNPEHVVGLPSYDEAVQNSAEDEKPPAYDSLFSTGS